MSENCSVYIIHSTSGHYKIGHSDSPRRRLKELQKTQGPYQYSMAYYWVLSSQEEARSIEHELHQLFAEKRVGGEWFGLTPMDLISIGYEFMASIRENNLAQAAFDKGLATGRRMAEYQEVPY